MVSKSSNKNDQYLKDVENVLEEENLNGCAGSPSNRHALRETASRLNRPLPMSSLLQTLPEDGELDLLHQENIDRPLGLSEDGDDGSNSNVVFGFSTPSKRRGRPSLLQIAITSSAQKKQQLQQGLDLEKSPPLQDPDQQNKMDKTPTRQGKRTPQKTPTQSSRRRGRTPGTPSTPRVSRGTLLTPKCVPKLDKAPTTGTPRSRRSLAPQLQDPEAAPPTPAAFKRRLRTRILEVHYDTDFDDEGGSSDEEDVNLDVSGDDSDNDKEYKPLDDTTSTADGDANTSQESRTTVTSTDEEDSDLEDKELQLKGKRKNSAGSKRCPPAVKRVGGRAKRSRPDVDQAASNDDYFFHNDGSSRVVTSDHTLNQLSAPRLSGEALRALIGSTNQDHLEERQALSEEHQDLFEKWLTLLHHGYSIFVHGVGSKKQLLSEFQRQHLTDENHIVVNGFFPSLTIKSILSSILEEILCLESCPASVPEMLSMLVTWYTRPSSNPLYIVIHNIDGPMLRCHSAQQSLSLLCSPPRVHLVCSVDHINAPLVFDSRRLSEYNGLWFDCTTLAAYTEETSYENSLLVQHNAGLALSSLIHVFKSLTPTSKGIFLLLSDYQLENQQDAGYAGMTFAELYQRCRERMLATSELTLRAQLTEFRDHKLLRQKKGQDGAEVLLVPLEAVTLREFVDDQRSKEEEG